MNCTNNAPVRTSFMRFCSTKYIKDLVKEAQRVEYTVDILGDTKGIYAYEVYDPTHNNSMVFKAVAIRPNYWGTTFSKVYWQEPTV